MCNEKINALALDIARLESELDGAQSEIMPLNETTDRTMAALAQMPDIWQAGNYEERLEVLNMCFSDKLEYEKVGKFRTPRLSPIFAVFNENREENIQWQPHGDSNPDSHLERVVS